MAFYTFVQQNVCDHWQYDETRGIAPYVIVECTSLDDAVVRAEALGLYFDRIDQALDGDLAIERWPRPWHEDELTETPQIFRRSPYEVRELYPHKNPYLAYIHYMNGKVTAIPWREPTDSFSTPPRE